MKKRCCNCCMASVILWPSPPLIWSQEAAALICWYVVRDACEKEDACTAIRHPGGWDNDQDNGQGLPFWSNNTGGKPITTSQDQRGVTSSSCWLPKCWLSIGSPFQRVLGCGVLSSFTVDPCLYGLVSALVLSALSSNLSKAFGWLRFVNVFRLRCMTTTASFIQEIVLETHKHILCCSTCVQRV